MKLPLQETSKTDGSVLQERSTQSQTEIAATKKRVHNILRLFEANKTTLESAKQQLEGLKRDAQIQRDATKQKFNKADSGSDSSEYQPKAGDSVRLLSMKGAKAVVCYQPYEYSLSSPQGCKQIGTNIKRHGVLDKHCSMDSFADLCMLIAGAQISTSAYVIESHC